MLKMLLLWISCNPCGLRTLQMLVTQMVLGSSEATTTMVTATARLIALLSLLTIGGHLTDTVITARKTCTTRPKTLELTATTWGMAIMCLQQGTRQLRTTRCGCGTCTETSQCLAYTTASSLANQSCLLEACHSSSTDACKKAREPLLGASVWSVGAPSEYGLALSVFRITE